MLLKPGETVEVRPNGEGQGPVYRLRAPLLYDRVQLDQAVARRGGKKHGVYELYAALRADVVTAMAESDDAAQREALLARIDAQVARSLGFGQRVSAGAYDHRQEDAETLQRFIADYDEVQRGDVELADIAYHARQLGLRYATGIAENEAYPQIFAIEAARLFLLGWEDEKPVPFRRGPQGLPDAVLQAIPPDHLTAIGARVQQLLKPDEETVKNSAGPSSGASAGKPSTARKPRAKKARSKARTAAPTGGTSRSSDSAEGSTPATSSLPS